MFFPTESSTLMNTLTLIAKAGIRSSCKSSSTAKYLYSSPSLTVNKPRKIINVRIPGVVNLPTKNRSVRNLRTYTTDYKSMW